MRRAALLTAAAVLATPAAAAAQAYRCTSSGAIGEVHADVASTDQPRRVLPIGGYTLALTWAPQWCRQHRDDGAAHRECGGGNRFGFTLHGLWPDGEGKEWPQYCAPAALLPPAVLRANLCATPSAQLLQHEWSKHGTCMAGETPATYFRRSTGLYARLRYPDTNALSRGPSLTAGGFAAALARANPGLGADAVRVTTARDGWLDEVWLCLDRRFRYARCRADSGGVAASEPLRIWRGAR